MEGRGWLTTFTDMLLLLFTFLVLIIAISRFKVTEGLFPGPTGVAEAIAPDEAKTHFIKGTAIELIKGLRTPRLPVTAQRILTEMAMASQAGTYSGVDLFYNENKISLMFPDQLTFSPGSDKLDEKAVTILQDLAKRIIPTPFRVAIEGHTDSTVGETIDNVDLSVSRAIAVARRLAAEGLNPQRISVSGYGPYRPIADNADIGARRLNRRVEIHIMVNETLL